MEKDDFQVFTLQQQTGDRRVNRIKAYYESKGFAVLTNKNFNVGVDLIVIEKVTGRVAVAIESTNYAKESEWMVKEKLDRYIVSLDWFDQLPDVKKQLYVSFIENLKCDKQATYDQEVERLRENKIELIVVGYQD